MQPAPLMTLPILENIKIASPCEVPWEEMQGDDRTRFCSHCSLHVHNLSAMTRVEAEAFMQNRTGRTCVRLFKRFDGTVLTQDCPVGLAAVREKIVRTVCATVALVFGIVSSAFLTYFYSANRNQRSSPTNQGVLHWVGGRTEKPTPFMGDVCLPPSNTSTQNNPIMGKVSHGSSKSKGKYLSGYVAD